MGIILDFSWLANRCKTSYCLTTICLFGSSCFLEGLRSTRRDGNELNQREEIVFIPVSIVNPLCDRYPVVEAFQLACEDRMGGMGNEATPKTHFSHKVGIAHGIEQYRVRWGDSGDISFNIFLRWRLILAIDFVLYRWNVFSKKLIPYITWIICRK